MIDWSKCSDVEVRRGTMGEEPVVKDTRIRARDVIANAEGITAEELVEEIYPDLPLNTVQRIISFYEHESKKSPRPS